MEDCRLRKRLYLEVGNERTAGPVMREPRRDPEQSILKVLLAPPIEDIPEDKGMEDLGMEVSPVGEETPQHLDV